MNRKLIAVLAAGTFIGAAPAVTTAQGVQRGEAIASSDVLSQISMFSYREGPKSDLYFRGTPLAATAEGKAKVEYQNGNAEISAEVEKLPAPPSLGPYTSYVLWALTPDGRAANQGVVAGIQGGKGKLSTQYSASQFALIVTAEPHYAVTVPSTMIVLYNVADNVKGQESKVTTLTERADYSALARIAVDDKASPEAIVQARYAVAIADAAGAGRFAPAPYAMAREKLAAAETALQSRRNSERRTAPGLAREAVTAGEDARRAAMLAAAAAESEAQRVAAARAATSTANEAAGVARRAASSAAASAAEAARRRSAADAGAASAAAAAAARDDLRNRLNAALPTRETSRGLVSEIGGVQFATAAATVNASARENLAKFSGIVASYPGLQISIEGHTDITGSVATNNELSLRRAMTVRDYLIERGVPASSIDVEGFGSSAPIGDNSTVAGRASNRRVEIVLSGGPLTVAAAR
jgi:outer membrane protein OmpA-like peptidoglycan-associated protein